MGIMNMDKKQRKQAHLLEAIKSAFMEAYQRQGTEDMTYAGRPDYKPHCSEPHYLQNGAGLSEAEALAAYNSGRQEAEQAKKENPSLFYARQVLREMESTDDWFRNDFDGPKWLLEQIIDLQKKERPPA